MNGRVHGVMTAVFAAGIGVVSALSASMVMDVRREIAGPPPCSVVHKAYVEPVSHDYWTHSIVADVERLDRDCSPPGVVINTRIRGVVSELRESGHGRGVLVAKEAGIVRIAIPVRLPKHATHVESQAHYIDIDGSARPITTTGFLKLP